MNTPESTRVTPPKGVRVEDRRTTLHILRNPYGWSEEAQREVRQKAANELERLWSIVDDASFTASNLAVTLKEGTGR